MADAFGLVWPGDKELFSACTNGTDVSEAMAKHNLTRVPLIIETTRARHADDLHQVLKDLVGLAKLASAPLNTYQAAIRNADELLSLIEHEEKETE